MHRHVAMLVLLVMLFSLPVYASSAAADAAEKETEARAEARRTILYPWSQEAKTDRLKIGAEAAKLLDLWLDYCRNKYGGRAKPSNKFRGVPHDLWECPLDAKKEGAVTLHVDFVKLRIDSAAMPLWQAADLLNACVDADKFNDAVSVDGDHPHLLRLWAFMLVSNVGREVSGALKGGAKSVNVEFWNKARIRMFEKIMDAWENSSPATERFPRLGTLASERIVLMGAVGALGGEGSGALLAKLHRMAVEGANEMEIREATRLLAASGTKEGNSFVLEELSSGDNKRLLAVIHTVKAGSDGKLIARVCDLLAAKDEQVLKACFFVLERVAAGADVLAERARKDMLAWFKQAPDDQSLKYDAACALVRLDVADASPAGFLKTMLEKLPATDHRAKNIEKVLADAAARGKEREAATKEEKKVAPKTEKSPPKKSPGRR